MKAILICPGERPGVDSLTRELPPVLLPCFGMSLLEYWLAHLASRAVSHVTVLAARQPEKVSALVANGARWGLKAEVIAELCESSPAAARREYHAPDDPDWLPEPEDAILMDHFPGLPEYPLFESYDGRFAALREFLPQAVLPYRLGVRELEPGVWVGLCARISATARLRAPCWVGEHVRIGPRSVVGPMAIIEDRALVGSDCEISSSVVGPQTFIGKCTEVKDSFAWGNALLNWKTGSFVKVPDPFLMCDLDEGLPLLRKPTDWLAETIASLGGNKANVQLFWKRRLAKKGG